MPDLSAMLERGPVVCAEGYLFECERRGYLQAGAFVPEVVLDHPEVVDRAPPRVRARGLRRGRGLHLLRAPAEAARRRQGGHPRAAEPAGPRPSRPEVADETGTLLAGNICNTNVYEPATRRRAKVRGDVRGAGRRGPPRRASDFIIAETFSWRRGAAGPGGHQARGPARGGDLALHREPADARRRQPGRRLPRRREQAGADVVGLNCIRGPRHHAAAARASARPCLRRRRAARALPDDTRRSRPCSPCATRAGRRARPFPPRSTPSPARATRWPSSPPRRSRSACATSASAAAPARTTSGRWPRRRRQGPR